MSPVRRQAGQADPPNRRLYRALRTVSSLMSKSSVRLKSFKTLLSSTKSSALCPPSSTGCGPYLAHDTCVRGTTNHRQPQQAAAMCEQTTNIVAFSRQSSQPALCQGVNLAACQPHRRSPVSTTPPHSTPCHSSPVLVYFALFAGNELVRKPLAAITRVRQFRVVAWHLHTPDPCGVVSR